MQSSEMPADERGRDGLAVLEALTVALGIAFDHTQAKNALQQAERELGTPGGDNWRQVMSQAAMDVGVRCRSYEASPSAIAKAVSRHTPVVGFAPERGVWVVLTDRRRKRLRQAALAGGGRDAWISTTEIANKLGQPNREEKVVWLLCHPLFPCETAAAADHSGHHGHLSPFRRLMRLMRPDRQDIGVVVCFGIGVGAFTLATPIAVQALVNTVAFGGLIQPVIFVSLLLFGALAFSAVMRGLQTYVVEIVQQRLFVRLVADLSYRLPRVVRNVYDRRHGPELVNRFFDVLTVQKVGALLLLDGLGVVLQAVIGLLVLAFYHPILLAFDIILLAAIAFVIFGLGRRAVVTAIDESRAKYEAAGWLEELARNPNTFKMNGGAKYAIDRADSFALSYLYARRRHFRVVFRQVIGALLLQVVASTALLSIGGFLVIEGQLTLGQLVAAELIVTLIVASLAKFGKHLESFYDLLAAVDKLGSLMDLPLERPDGEAHSHTNGGASLTLSNVACRLADGRQVFAGVNAHVAPGECVALTAPDGGGKSILLQMIFGMRAPAAGYVQLDGVDIRSIRLDELRRHVALISDIEVFEGSILDNVTLGRADISPAQARAALAAVDLLDEVSGLPDGLFTSLTTGGLPLSQGQVRRLIVARALAARPRLLLVDDVLEGLDRASLEIINDALFDPNSPLTLIVVSDRADVLRRCSRVVEMRRSPAAATADGGA